MSWVNNKSGGLKMERVLMKHRFQVPIFWVSAPQMFSYSSFSLGVTLFVSVM
ncbi:hypothetical protein PAHAL_3G285900 [Panicum hallii]|jgi:hypothetical protein|uniref:Uncharacterized protein n=1 Tax=Panicum hallii TaxID=206008 RepID=A0A2T8KJQ7_9POAL|nr:hypothetical protein PAHAL_3G285900 [Panicum hallii]